MAKRRTLKRNINTICNTLYAECVAVSLYGAKANSENIQAVVIAVAKLEADFISRMSHVEPGVKPKAFFAKLIEQFNAQVEEIADQLKYLS